MFEALYVRYVLALLAMPGLLSEASIVGHTTNDECDAHSHEPLPPSPSLKISTLP